MVKHFTAFTKAQVYYRLMYYDCQIKALLDVIEALEQRVASLEQKASNSEKKNPDMQVELSVTKASLKKVREAIMNVFRM